MASPNNTHLEYATAALKAGKHGKLSSRLRRCSISVLKVPVLVEKPMCPTSAEAKQLVDLAQSKGLTLSVYQNRRWDGDYLTVKKLLAEGTVRLDPLPPSAYKYNS